jgi:DNA primase
MDAKVLVQSFQSYIALENLIAEISPIERDGSRIKARCPFPHGGTLESPEPDLTASMVVYPEQQSWYCYGCHKGQTQRPDRFGRKNYGNDIIAFWQELLRQQMGREVAFMEAAKSLAEHIKQPDLIPTQVIDPEAQRAYEVQKSRSERWHNALLREHLILQYVRNRGVSDSVIKARQLGYVTDVGECRHRLSIPIRHAFSGKVLGFGFRATHDGQEPKYKNSTNSAIFKSGDHFYGLYEAREAIMRDREVLLTEDYFGPLAMASLGIQNVIGCRGSSLLDPQIELIRKITDTVTWWMEDEAGYGGLISMAPQLLKQGLRVFVIPADADADEICLDLQSETAVRNWIDERKKPLLSWAVDEQKRLYQAEQYSEDRLLQQLALLYQSVSRPADRAIFARDIRRAFGVDAAHF